MSLRECTICEGSLDDGTPTTVVKTKGLSSFAEASNKRGDGKVVLFKRLTEIEVHEKCRKQYTNEKLIAAHVKRSAQAVEPRKRSDVPQFHFKTHCLVCGEEVPPDYAQTQIKKPPHKRNVVYPVRKLAVRDTVLGLARNRSDEFGRAIIRRVEPVNDLVAADAQYHLLCMKALHLPQQSPRVQESGTQLRGEVELAMDDIYTYLEQSDEECQFTIEELVAQVKGDFQPHYKTVIRHLTKKYADNILITANKPYIVCFKGTGYKLINEKWLEDLQKLPENEERLRIVETAAAIIVEDVRSQVYDVTSYPPVSSFLEGHEDLIPQTLLAFTDKVVLTKKRGDLDKWRKKSLTFAHCLVSAVRPNSFVSPVLVGLSAFMYKKFGSRGLIDVLNSLGLCASYNETVRFEVSAIMRPPLTLKETAFSQVVGDNADTNIQTLDGHRTFHSMGSIVCVTPKSAIVPGQRIARLKKTPSAEVVGSMADVQLQIFERTNDAGLAAVEIENLASTFHHTDVLVPSVPNLLWLYGKFADLPGIGGWNGFMGQVTRDVPYEKTFIDCVPFINAHPTDMDTVYTALLLAVEKTRALGQETTIVTFDQPLYLKARDIVASRVGDPKLSHIVVRLGGFHLLMSFMGAVGYIMQGSGLTEAFNTVYAVNSTEKIMTGHAYSRAVRAHMLTYRTLGKIIFESLEFSSEFNFEIDQLMYGKDRTEILSVGEHVYVKELHQKFLQKLEELEKVGPTSKLWIQYFGMITLLLRFIESERMGDWSLHLQTIYDMLPYFHASGHYLYAKCAHLYLQDMSKLEQTMPPQEFHAFAKKGAFTIRRSDKCWSGTWSDMVIEQTLMKQMKIEGGLSRTRGFSAGILARWTLGMTSLLCVADTVEEFCGVHLATTEQHSDTSNSRIRRDNEDSEKMLAWFQEHPPFSNSQELMSIGTGIVGNEKINCHLAREIGTMCITNIVGSDFKTVKFKRSDRVLPLATMNSSILVEGHRVVINPDTLMQRMCVAKQSDEELQDFLCYELSPYPRSLFDSCGMRKGTKSTLYKAFQPLPDTSVIDGNTWYVIDGGFLLHRVIWCKRQTYSAIADSYVQHVKSKYGPNVKVVFDGYPEGQQGTKSMERLRRAKVKHAVELQFTESMVPTVSQEHFLSNDRNKNRLITLLMAKFRLEGIDTLQAQEDADTLIVQTALSVAQTKKIVVVVGEDIDLLVIMTGLGTPTNVYFFKPGRGKAPSSLYQPHDMEKFLAENILFLHAVSGCDSTSAIFNQGKMKFLKTIKKNPEMARVVNCFTNPQSLQEEIGAAGANFLVALYGGDYRTTRLNVLRYKLYLSTAYKVAGNMTSIPPTEAAAHQHSLRVFYQVQQWLGNQDLDPEQWGWKSTSSGLTPVMTSQAPAPEKLLRNISCKCRKDVGETGEGCRGGCGCRRAGLFCSKLCVVCEGNCSNIDTTCYLEDDDVDDADDPSPVQQLEETDHTPSVETPAAGASSVPDQPVRSTSPQPGPSRPKRKRQQYDE